MPDLTETAVVGWFTPIRPPNLKNAWPPVVRPLEQADGVETLLETLGLALDDLGDKAVERLVQLFEEPGVNHDLQITLSQLGGARFLRITDWFANALPQGGEIIVRLSQGRSTEAQAIKSSIRVLTARASVDPPRVYSRGDAGLKFRGASETENAIE